MSNVLSDPMGGVQDLLNSELEVKTVFETMHILNFTGYLKLLSSFFSCQSYSNIIKL